MTSSQLALSTRQDRLAPPARLGPGRSDRTPHVTSCHTRILTYPTRKVSDRNAISSLCVSTVSAPRQARQPPAPSMMSNHILHVGPGTLQSRAEFTRRQDRSVRCWQIPIAVPPNGYDAIEKMKRVLAYCGLRLILAVNRWHVALRLAQTKGGVSRIAKAMTSFRLSGFDFLAFAIIKNHRQTSSSSTAMHPAWLREPTTPCSETDRLPSSEPASIEEPRAGLISISLEL